MSTTGWVPFGSCVHVAGAGLDWVKENGGALDADAVLADDAKMASFIEASNSSTDILRVTNSDIAGLIPAGSEITNRQIRFKRHRDSLSSALAVTQIAVSLWIEGALVGGPQVTLGDWPTVAAIQTLNATLHSQTVTRDQIVAANTGLQLIAQLAEGLTSSIDPTHYVGLIEQNVTFNAPDATDLASTRVSVSRVNIRL